MPDYFKSGIFIYIMDKLYSIFLSVIFFSFIILHISCSSTSGNIQTNEQESDSSYTFDEQPPDDIITFETPEKAQTEIYFVQIGAFNGFDNAKQFAELSRLKLNREIKVNFNEINDLYVVYILPPFNSKQDALKYCNSIRLIEAYKDAWVVKIITIEN